MTISVEYCVMSRQFPDEPHRGPMSLEAAERWVNSLIELGIGEDAFFVAKREVSSWVPVH